MKLENGVHGCVVVHGVVLGPVRETGLGPITNQILRFPARFHGIPGTVGRVVAAIHGYGILECVLDHGRVQGVCIPS